MALDYDAILDEFIRVAREAVGPQLSQIGPAGSEFPAVIRSRQQGTSPDYPYVQLDLTGTQQTNGWKTGEGLDDLTDNPFVDTHYRLLLRYTVYGGNANKVAHDLEAYFRFNRVLGEIEVNTGGTLEQTFQVTSIPQPLSTELLETATFDLTFNINDRAVDQLNGAFDTVFIDGSLARNIDDPDPLNLDVSATSL